ncbi:MAG: hypothetical protein KDK70_07930 [Myxococcales bacterium]|nr:hypothetical protein [Myxococcales bacterium]
MPSLRRSPGAGAGAVASGAVVLAGLTGCVYPATEPTGVELSWRFVEQNLADGEDAVRVRSCEGAFAEQIAVAVEDQDTPARQGIFRFDCTQGYQTAIDLQTEASDAFIRLDPGPYTIALHAVDDAMRSDRSELLDTREVEVEGRIITISTWELSRGPVDWSVELRSADACDSMTLSLYYATPQIDLAEYTPDEEQTLPLYRTALASDRGLPVGGEPIACAAELSGAHAFVGLDRGEYLLEVAVDGTVCALRVDLHTPEGASSVIDLANLPCEG